jgi:transglutaminase superfamily protein
MAVLAAATHGRPGANDRDNGVMPDDDYTPHGDHPPTPELTALRLRAEQFCRNDNDGELLTLADQLRDDHQLWPHLWVPAAAIAASRTGRDEALDLLRESVDAGFSQPELFDGVLEARFAESPGWPELVKQMDANVPAPAMLLLDWPDPAPTLPLELDLIPAGRAAEFRDRLPSPAPGATAWESATMMLEWVRRQWQHANDHVDDPDALDVLERVDAGERFACVEYSIVLSQALNAIRIPARRLSLRQRHHHVGIGRGHLVSEAWIDDLDQWVVLDGQNGSYWVDESDAPMSTLDLQEALRSGGTARMVGLVDEMSESESARWLTYFTSVTTTGYTWAVGPFCPIFQEMGVIKTGRLLRDGRLAYPRLSDIAVGYSGTLAEPVVRLKTEHPYAVGFRATEGGRVADVEEAGRWAIDVTPGRHHASVAVRTEFAVLSGRGIEYDVREV